MPLIEWKENFNLGVGQFDANHQRLAEILNKAYDDFVQDSNTAAFAATVDEFFEFAIEHFVAEEHYMEENSYAGYAEHLELHRSFSAQAELMQKDLKSVWKKLPFEQLAFLKNWLMYDILVADADYVSFASGSEQKLCA